jgi:hypothetical protein
MISPALAGASNNYRSVSSFEGMPLHSPTIFLSAFLLAEVQPKMAGGAVLRYVSG